MYFKKKNDMYFTDMDEDFDDTFEDDVDSEESRSYVELPKEAAPAGETPVFEEAEELSETTRGAGGFGSTGAR